MICYGMDDIVWYDMIWYGMVWYGMVWYGMVWYGMVWYGMVWCNKAWYVMDILLQPCLLSYLQISGLSNHQIYTLRP